MGFDAGCSHQKSGPRSTCQFVWSPGGIELELQECSESNVPDEKTGNKDSLAGHTAGIWMPEF